MTFVPTETGHWVDENFARLAEIIQDYDEHFELRWIPPDKRTTVEDRAKPYCVVDTTNNQNYIIFYVSELDTPEQVLEKLFLGDNKHGNVLDRMNARNAAVAALEMKERLEQMAEAKEFSAFVLGNEKNVWKHDGVKYDSEMRRI